MSSKSDDLQLLSDLDAIVERFERDWYSGKYPQIEQVLAESPGIDRLRLLIELVHTELELRLRAGQTVVVEDYLKRFADLEGRSSVLLDLVEAEFEIRRRLGQSVNAGEYERRFPDLASAIRNRLQDATVQIGRRRSDEPSLPSEWGQYELCERLGAGGMGVVYRALDKRLERYVAIKICRAADAHRADVVERFLTEAKVTAQLQHPGIPPVYELGILPNGLPFLAMKLVKGRTFESVLSSTPVPARVEHCLGIFEQVCHAIGYAHARNVIHRDLKPANIMVGKHGEVHVMDWGLAKIVNADVTLEASGRMQRQETVTQATRIERASPNESPTRTGAVMGTPAYMAPEQAAGRIERIGPHTDVFALGAILCEMLTGTTPYAGRSVSEIQSRAIRGDLRDALQRLDASHADPQLIALCKRCLEFLPQDRPANGAEVAAAVARIREQAEERARNAELEKAKALIRAGEENKRRRLETRLRRWMAAAVCVLAVGLVVAVVLGIWAHRARMAADEAARRERAAMEQARREAAIAKQRARQVANASDLLASIFDGIDVHRLDRPNGDLRSVLAERLKAAANRLQGEKFADPLLTANLQLRLSRTLAGLGYFSEAEPPARQAMEVFQRRLGKTHPASLSAIHNLGLIHCNTAAFSKAVPLLEFVLDQRRSKLGPDHPETLNAMNSLAGAYQAMGKTKQAIGLYRELLERSTKTLGRGHYQSILTMNNLAAALKANGNLTAARNIAEEAVRIAHAALGGDHVLTWTCKANLGTLLGELGDRDKARALLEESLARQTALRGVHHPETLMNMSNLAAVYLMLDRESEALRLFEDAARGIEKHAKHHPYFRSIVQNASRAFARARRWAKAEHWQRTWLEFAESHHRLDPPTHALELAFLARLMLRQRKYSGAEPVIQKALDLIKPDGNTTWVSFQLKSMLGECRLAAGRLDDAGRLLLESYSGLVARYAAISPAEREPRLQEAAARLICYLKKTWRSEVVAQMSGTLSETDVRAAHRHNFEAGCFYLIEAVSDDFDTYLELHDPGGKLVIANDDIDFGGGMLNSRILILATQPGAYRISVTSYGGMGRGDYELKVTRFTSRNGQG